MGWDFCESGTVKTRKEHKCAFCGRTIPKGSKNIFNWHGMYDGDFQNSYSCDWCEKHQDSLLSDDNEITEDIGTCLQEDIFYEKLKDFDYTYIEIDKNDSDWFIFKDYDTDEEVHREYCPIIEKENDND